MYFFPFPSVMDVCYGRGSTKFGMQYLSFYTAEAVIPLRSRPDLFVIRSYKLSPPSPEGGGGWRGGGHVSQMTLFFAS